MSKTSVSTMISRVKRQFDYDITDTDLDNLIVDKINNSLKLLKQWLMDNGLLRECSKTSSFKTVENQDYVDLSKARIVGNVATFTGIANDKIKVTIDGTDYDNIVISACTTIALVASAINTSVGSTVASVSDDGYLIITSPTSGASSAVVIADGSTTGQTVVGDLFSVSAERSQSAIDDVDEIIALTERTNDTPIIQVSMEELKEFNPNPTAYYAITPDFFSRFVEKLYFSPTPSDNIYLYIDYIFNITEITSASTLPFNNKYDPLIEAICVQQLQSWLNPDKIQTANVNLKFWYEALIEKASRNIGQRNGTASRKDEISYPAPRKVIN